MFLDLSAAFDTIDHETLMDRLKAWFGISGNILSWFRSYLCDHFQRIKIDSVLSDSRKLIYGVPQGSVLCPILFLYTTPLACVIAHHPHIRFHFYAHDTQLYIHLTHQNATQALKRLNTCLDDVKKWMAANKLKLNPDKTEFVVFGSKVQRLNWLNFFPSVCLEIL